MFRQFVIWWLSILDLDSKSEFIDWWDMLFRYESSEVNHNSHYDFKKVVNIFIMLIIIIKCFVYDLTFSPINLQINDIKLIYMDLLHFKSSGCGVYM